MMAGSDLSNDVAISSVLARSTCYGGGYSGSSYDPMPGAFRNLKLASLSEQSKAENRRAMAEGLLGKQKEIRDSYEQKRPASPTSQEEAKPFSFKAERLKLERTYYKALGVEQGCTFKEIEDARVLAMKSIQEEVDEEGYTYKVDHDLASAMMAYAYFRKKHYGNQDKRNSSINREGCKAILEDSGGEQEEESVEEEL